MLIGPFLAHPQKHMGISPAWHSSTMGLAQQLGEMARALGGCGSKLARSEILSGRETSQQWASPGNRRDREGSREEKGGKRETPMEKTGTRNFGMAATPPRRRRRCVAACKENLRGSKLENQIRFALRKCAEKDPSLNLVHDPPLGFFPSFFSLGRTPQSHIFSAPMILLLLFCSSFGLTSKSCNRRLHSSMDLFRTHEGTLFLLKTQRLPITQVNQSTTRPDK